MGFEEIKINEPAMNSHGEESTEKKKLFNINEDQIREIKEWKKKKKKEEKPGISRRTFLKAGISGALAFAGMGKIKKGLDYITSEGEEKLKQEKKEEKKIMKDQERKEIKNIADYYLQAYNKLSKSNEHLPGDIFEEDLLIAQQCQESRGDIDAKSHSGALGVMQNMKSSIIDVTRYLNILKANENFEWEGPKELSDMQVEDIKKLIIEKSDYSRAFGKIYLMQLWDDKHGYSVGRKQYEKGDIKAAQIELMGAYNAGFGRVKGKTVEEWKKLRDMYKNKKDNKSQRKYRAYKEVVIYVDRIFNYKKRLGNIRNIMGKMNVIFDGNGDDYAAREIALKLDEVTGFYGEARKIKLEQEINKYLKEFKKINNIYGRGPTDKEIDTVVNIKR